MDERHDSLFARVLGLCLLRTAPQDLPHAPALVVGFAVAGVALGIAKGVLLGNVDGALAQTLISIAVVTGLCWAALALRKLRNRFVQTATALLAVRVLFALVQIPVLLFAPPPPTTPDQLVGLQLLLGWVLLGVFAWQLVVYAHIMRHAMDAGFGFALVLVATWAIANWSLAHLLLGG